MVDQVAEYLDKLKQIQCILHDLFDNDSPDENDYDDLFEIIRSSKFNEDPHKIKLFLYLFSKITKNHHRNHNFNQTIERIINYFAKDIKNLCSNSDIFDIFKNNKLILLFLFKEKIIMPNNEIYLKIAQKKYLERKYPQYFFTEFQSFLNDMEEKPELNENSEENRVIGENDLYICRLIRNDFIEEFISHVNKTNMDLRSRINPSIFETNTFLLKNKSISLIQYATFFGSIQIFQYLRMNDVELEPSLWIFAIHSNNAELIHLLEEYHVEPPSSSYEKCFAESIKCHHNEISNYISNVSLNGKYESCFSEGLYKLIFRYHNYYHFPNNLNQSFVFYFLFQYDYYFFVDLLLQANKELLNVDFGAFIITKKNEEMVDLLLSQSGKEIKPSMFKYSDNIKQITIPSFIQSIGFKSFYRCTSLTTLVIPSSVTSIDDYAFSRCSSLQHISIPTSIKAISNCCFEFCLSLQEISLPPSIESIGSMAFQCCSRLRKVSLPSSLLSIGTCAFYSCCFLEIINIPKSVKYIGYDAFGGIKLYRGPSPNEEKNKIKGKHTGNMKKSKCNIC